MKESVNGDRPDSEKAFNELVEAVGALRDRIEFAQRHGLSFDGDRDIYDALGYDRSPKIERYWEMYARQDIAGFIIDKAPETTWKNKPTIEGLGSQFDELTKDVGFWSNLMKVDKISRVGEYGVLLLGLEDSEDFSQPVDSSDANLMYLQAYPDIGVNIEQVVEDENDPRYGKPKTYEFESVEDKSSVDNFDFNMEIDEVHWTRVIHVTDNNLVSNIIGRPNLERIYNRLKDLQKVVGSTAEAHWKEIDPTWDIQIDDEANIDPDAVSELKDEMKSVVHGMQRILAGQGREVKKITASVNDPSDPFDVIMSLIAAGTIYTKRQLTGSERGELASTMDQQEYYGAISERQTWHAEPEILRPTINRLQEYGALSDSEYEIEWPNLFELTKVQEAKVASNLGQAAKNLGQAVTQGLLTAEQAFEILNIDATDESMNQNTLEELEAMKEMLDDKIEEQRQ